MRTSGKKTFLGSLLVLFGAVSVGMANPTLADTRTDTWIKGTPVEVSADPEDFVVKLDQSGPCKQQNYFQVSRSNVNFREMVEVILTAFSNNRQLRLHVTSCDISNRNIFNAASVSK